MLNATRAGSRGSRKPKFLLDRCLSKRLAHALRQFGYEVQTLEEVFGVRATEVADVEWIEWAAANGFTALTANPNIIYVPHEKAAVVEQGTRVFCIANPQQTREGRGMIFGRHLLRMLRRSRRPGPCFWRLPPSDQVTYDIP